MPNGAKERRKQTFQETYVTALVPRSIHRELLIEKAHSGKQINVLLAEAWSLYKRHTPQPWRKGAA
jgi:hypothetical protein